jgi:hypothetical protein
MAEFIPGPYRVDVRDTWSLATIYTVTTQPTEDGLGQGWVNILTAADIAGWPMEEYRVRRLATAYLFAAAPALYVALKDLRDWFNGEDDDTQNQDIVLAADKAMALARNEADEKDIRTRHERVMAVIEQGTDADFDLSELATAVIKECFR